MKKKTQDYTFFDRDLSWLSFNDRVLREAERETVPLMERVRFLSIYSSNLDEFYRVRVPAINALKNISSSKSKGEHGMTLKTINQIVSVQQRHFGKIMEGQIVPALREKGIEILYKEPIPKELHSALEHYFITMVASFIRYNKIGEGNHFFPESNQLYIVVTLRSTQKEVYLVNIPSHIPRFYAINTTAKNYVVVLDDIIKLNLHKIFAGRAILSKSSIKITRDSDLNLDDEYTGNLARKIEKQIMTRDRGLATRLLYEPGTPVGVLKFLVKNFGLDKSGLISGGQYHNLKDLGTLPIYNKEFQWESWPRGSKDISGPSLFDEIRANDILIHPPFHKYDRVLQFFNEASIDTTVKTIYVTLYRVASDSRIAHALIGAALNGKKVIVFVELKARFDEANNIKWMKKMKAAGVRIIESIPGLKVHAKLALVKRKVNKKTELIGLFSTGNFNEVTASFYTDHILMTSDKALLEEGESLFKFLKKRRKKTSKDKLSFHHLLVGHFNLQEGFTSLIDREMRNAEAGLPAAISIKFNNLEDRGLIAKLYDASNAGVKITLIVRGICCLVPGVANQSENITVTRIIDRYLEHGRIFVFENNGDPEILLGSADWMNRNIYRRIEVCFPIRDFTLKSEIMQLLTVQISDNSQAVEVDSQCQNIPVPKSDISVRSQYAIAELIGTSSL